MSKLFLHYISFFGCILLLTFYISNHWYQLLLIHGESMSPSYHNMQLVILDKHSDNYTYGDVIAFRCDNFDALLIKRVVACPDDEVVIKDGHLYINNAISTIFPLENRFDYAGIAEEAVHLAQGQYFVIGDNISQSKDSRYSEVGCVDVEKIIGSVL